MKKNLPDAFTLIELLVVIAIVAIIALGITKLNFNTISDKQKLKIVATKIISNFETVRWNALMWKGIWTHLDIPESYQINFSTTWSGNIITQYLSWTLQAYTDIIPLSFWANFNEVSNIECAKLDNSTGSLSGNTGSIIIKWWNLSLTGCTEPSSKKINIEIKRKQYSETIQINTLNWLVSID